MRVGLIIPSVNVVLEHDLRLFVPPTIMTHVTRVKLTIGSPQALQAALDEAPQAACLLADAGVSALALACTGASMMAKPGQPTAAEQMTARTGLPAIDTMGALFAAFRVLAVRRILLVSPFGDAFNAIEAAALASGGIEVVKTEGFGISNAADCATLSPETISARAMAADLDDVEAIFLSCANLRGFEAAAGLEQKIGKPVITTNQAVLWALLRLAGSTEGPPDGGTLFKYHCESF